MMPSTRKEALAGGYKRYNTGASCVKGHVSDRRARTGECLACRAEFLVQWRAKNPSSVKKHNDVQYAAHSRKIKEHVKQWGQKNPTKLLAYTRLSQTKRKLRCPKWLTADDRWMLEQAYELAALRTKLFGFTWHVDHIIPLQGKLVSGLHTPYNVQVIPGADNVRKSNKFEAVA